MTVKEQIKERLQEIEEINIRLNEDVIHIEGLISEYMNLVYDIHETLNKLQAEKQKLESQLRKK